MVRLDPADLPGPRATPAEPPPPPPADVPAATSPGSPAETPHSGGDAPGEPHPAPRAYSPRGGPLGPLVGLDTVRDAVEATFTARVGSYIAAVQAERPHITNPPLAAFHDWINQPGVSTVTPGQEPRYVVTCPGPIGQPRRKGDGSYAITFLVRVQLWLWGRQWRDAETRLAAYLVAARTCLLQNGSLDGVVRSTTWRGETLAPIQQVGSHTWGQASLELAVFVDPASAAWAGPAPLDPAAPIRLPEPISSVGIAIADVPLDAPLPDLG